ncbi:hypothetical protein BOTBODRAFT_177813 [Botryobasidium botryosum FD-172 SS1]|uniref:Uncharacterized protein n=1 Tax=Botryobasidium botryosum (strain FD-172 SS1) TaxID=930990 RepID=A0A067M5W2_BOTB1|nr:hypothetical protein BOTBODRAFT_177813 [Botryobasidium botryosum FD-172 SS1]
MTTTIPFAVLDGYAATTTNITPEAAFGLPTTLAKESVWNPRLSVELAEGLEDPAMFSEFAGHWASMYGFILEEMPLMALWTLREDFLSRRGYVGTALMNNKFHSHAYTSAEGISTQSARKNSQTTTAAVMDSQHTAAQAVLLQSTAMATPFALQDAREHDRRSVSRLRWENTNDDERVFAALSNTKENSISRIGDSPPITTSPTPTVFESAQPNPQTRRPPRPLVLSSPHANAQRTSPRGPRSPRWITKTRKGALLPRSPPIGSPLDPNHQGRSTLARTPRVHFTTLAEHRQRGDDDDDGEPSAHIVGALSLRGSKPSIGPKIEPPCPPHQERQHRDIENGSESRELESSERRVTPPVYLRRNDECSSRVTEGNIPYHDDRDKIPNRRPGEYITRFRNKREAHASNQCAFNATGFNKTRKGASLPRLSTNGSPLDPIHQGDALHRRTLGVQSSSPADQARRRNSDSKASEPRARTIAALSSGSPKPSIGLGTEPPYALHCEWRSTERENGSASRTLVLSQRGNPPPVYLRTSDEHSSCVNEGSDPYLGEGDKLPDRHLGTCTYITHLCDKRGPHATNLDAPSAFSTGKARWGALLPRYLHAGSPPDPNYQGYLLGHDTPSVYPTDVPEQGRRRDDDETADKSHEPAAIIRAVEALSLDEPPYSLHREWRPIDIENGSQSRTLESAHQEETPPVYLRNNDAYSSGVHEGNRPYRDERDKFPSYRSGTYITRFRSKREPHVTNRRTSSATSPERTRKGVLPPRLPQTGISPDSNRQGLSPGYYSTPSVYPTSSLEQGRQCDANDTANKCAAIARAVGTLSNGDLPQPLHREQRSMDLENGLENRKLELAQRVDTPPAHSHKNDEHSSYTTEGNIPYYDERDKIPNRRPGAYITRVHNKPEAHTSNRCAFSAICIDKTRKGALLPCLPPNGSPRDPIDQGHTPQSCTPSVHLTEQDRDSDGKASEPYARSIDTRSSGDPKLSIGLGMEPPYALHREWRSIEHENGLQSRTLAFFQRGKSPPGYSCKNDEFPSGANKGKFPYRGERDKIPDYCSGMYITRIQNKRESHVVNARASSTTGPPSGLSNHHDAERRHSGPRTRQTRSSTHGAGTKVAWTQPQEYDDPTSAVHDTKHPSYSLHQERQFLDCEDGYLSRGVEYQRRADMLPVYQSNNDESSSRANEGTIPYRDDRETLPSHRSGTYTTPSQNNREFHVNSPCASGTASTSSGLLDYHDTERRLRGLRTRQTGGSVPGLTMSWTRPKNYDDPASIPSMDGDTQRPQYSYHEWPVDRKKEHQACSSHTPTLYNRAHDDAGCDWRLKCTAIKADARSRSRDLSTFHVHSMGDHRTGSPVKDSAESSTRREVPARYTNGYDIRVNGTHASGTRSSKSNELRGPAADMHSYGSSRACRENRKPESITHTTPDDGRRKGKISACHTCSLIIDGSNENATNSQRGEDLRRSKVNPNIVHAPSAYLQPNRGGAASSNKDNAEHRSEDSYAMLTRSSSALDSGNTHAPRYETGLSPPCEISQGRLSLKSSVFITRSVKTSDEESSSVSGIFFPYSQESGWDTPDLDWLTPHEEKPRMNQHGEGTASYVLACSPTDYSHGLSPALTRPEYRVLYDKDRRYRFELRTVNAPAWPASPAHPQLVKDEAPTLCADGTFGDRNYLYTPIPFDRKRIWLHYIPALNMWTKPLPGHHFEQPPIYIKPRESNSEFWHVSAADHAQGRFTSELYSDMRTFWTNGLTHAYALQHTAKEYMAVPVDPTLANWEGILETGSYSTLIRPFVALQHRIGELYGWIMLQEKLQPDVPSIVPHCRPLRTQDLLSPIDYLVGVIVPWDDRSPDFDEMAIEHGVCLWWCDYAKPGTSEMPAWRGLNKAVKEEVAMHRGAGFIAIVKDPGSRKFFVDRTLAEDDHGHYEFPARIAGRARGLEAPISGPSHAPARPLPSTSAGSRAEASTSTRRPVAEMSLEELAVFWAESAARCKAHILAGTSKARNPNKKPKKNRAQRQAARTEAEKRGLQR